MIDRLSRAGTESQLLALIRYVDRRRIEPSLVLLDGEDDLSRRLEPSDCPVLRLGVRRLLSRAAWRAAQRLLAFWRERPPQVLQAFFLDAAYFSIPLARRAGIPHIVRVRNNLGYWRTRRHRWMERLLRPWVDAVLTNSEPGREQLVRLDGYSPQRVVVIENGVDIDRFPVYLLPDTTKKRVRVGCVANLRPVKNIDGLMRAAQYAVRRHPQLVFEVAGEGEQRPALERLHQELQLGPHFVLRGPVEDIPAFLRSTEIAVLVSHSEGMSNALLEYMAAGRAIIATDVGANARLIRHRRDGLIIPPNDPQAVVAAIAELMEHPLRAAAYGASARKRAEQLFSRTAMVRRFETFYADLTDGRFLVAQDPLAAPLAATEGQETMSRTAGSLRAAA